MPSRNSPGSRASLSEKDEATNAGINAVNTNKEKRDDATLPNASSTSKTSKNVGNKIIKKKKQQMLRQIEVTEGVDMFKEKFASDDAVKDKAGKALRANPKQVDLLKHVHVHNAKHGAPKQRGRPPKAAADGAPPKKRGRPPKAAADGAPPKKRGRPPKAAADGAPPKKLQLDSFPDDIHERVIAINETDPDRAARLQQLLTLLNMNKDLVAVFDSPDGHDVEGIDDYAQEIDYFAIDSKQRLVLCAPR